MATDPSETQKMWIHKDCLFLELEEEWNWFDRPVEREFKPTDPEVFLFRLIGVLGLLAALVVWLT